MKSDKIITVAQASDLTKDLQKSNKKVVFTNGCFDMLHTGHIHLLKEAKKYGDQLIIGLNSDDSVKRLKGSGRPLQSSEIRKLALLSTGIVDEVIIFEENTPLALIEALKPDFLVKGGDYQKSEIVGANFVESYGGKIQIVATLDGYSTTNLVKALNDHK